MYADLQLATTPGLNPEYNHSILVMPEDPKPLWQELAVLDEVAKAAENTLQAGSFFGSQHAHALESLRQSQLALTEILANHDNVLREKQLTENWNESQLQNLKEHLSSMQANQKLSDQVTESMNLLDRVSESVKDLESTSDNDGQYTIA